MTNKEAIHLIEIVRDCGGYKNTNGFLFTDAFNKAIEALEKCKKFGTCKDCDEADFCYNRKDACYCLRHNHIMYSDDTCSYFYRGEDWSDE